MTVEFKYQRERDLDYGLDASGKDPEREEPGILKPPSDGLTFGRSAEASTPEDFMTGEFLYDCVGVNIEDVPEKETQKPLLQSLDEDFFSIGEFLILIGEDKA